MNFKLPKNTEKYFWTNHVFRKMMFYNLSESRIKRVLRHPKRVEEGIAPDTVACMQSGGSEKRPEEIWVMFQTQKEKGKRKSREEKLKIKKPRTVIISTWRYPGTSPKGKPIVIPEDVLEDLRIANYELCRGQTP